MTESTTFDPTQHEGCLYLNGNVVIITSEKVDQLKSMTTSERRELHVQTLAELRLHNIESGIRTMSIENIDESYLHTLLLGYMKGLALLGLM